MKKETVQVTVVLIPLPVEQRSAWRASLRQLLELLECYEKENQDARNPSLGI